MSTHPIGNGFAQSAAVAWERIHEDVTCDRCGKLKPCDEFATPRICLTCVTEHVEDLEREIRNYRAKLRNCKRYAEKALTSTGLERVWLDDIARECLPHTEGTEETDEKWTRR